MFQKNWQRHIESHLYSRLDDNEEKVKSTGKSRRCLNSSSEWLLYCFIALLATIVALAALTGYLWDTLQRSNQAQSKQLQGTAVQGTTLKDLKLIVTAFLPKIVEIGVIKKSFQYNTTYATPPPESGGPEPMWDSMIPSRSDIYRIFAREV